MIELAAEIFKSDGCRQFDHRRGLLKLVLELGEERLIDVLITPGDPFRIRQGQPFSG
jgi:hypothetical protein